MTPSINCQSYKAGGKCTHQAAPRRLFGCASCILTDFEYAQMYDPRINVTCKLKVEHPRPDPPRGGSSVR